MKTDRVCCDRMGLQLNWHCDLHDTCWECPDALIAQANESYGLIIHDGGTSVIAISHCPWCGTLLG
jgi:hypothetical protein